MLLTLKPPTLHNPIGAGSALNSFHDYSSSQQTTSTSLYTPASSSSPPQTYSAASSHPHPPLPISPPSQIGMSNSRPPINLPPPLGMSQSSQSQQQQQSSQQPSTSLAALPPAPVTWERSDDGMRSWLSAKAEEDKRKQEEEKTRQEGFRLEQRKLERDMLHESLERGVPPPMVPIIFAGMSGASNVPVDVAVQWSHHYLEAARQQQAQQQEIEMRAAQALHSNPYANHPLPAASSQPAQAQGRLPPSQAGALTPYQQPNRPRGDTTSSNPTSAPRPEQRLERLNTNEMTPNQPPRAPPGALMAAPSSEQVQQPPQQQAPQQTPQQQQQQQQPSPNIFFYHWQPPSTQATQPTTPQEFANSPKRRKITGPPHGTHSSQTSPQFQSMSTESTPGRKAAFGPGGQQAHHSRNRSESSSLKGSDSQIPQQQQQQQPLVAGRYQTPAGDSSSSTSGGGGGGGGGSGGGSSSSNFVQNPNISQLPAVNVTTGTPKAPQSASSSEGRTPKMGEAVPVGLAGPSSSSTPAEAVLIPGGRRRQQQHDSADHRGASADPESRLNLHHQHQHQQHAEMMAAAATQERDPSRRRTPTRKREDSRD